MQSSVHVRLLGIEIGVHWTWFVVFVLVSWTLEANLFTRTFPEWTGAEKWTASVLMAALAFTSVLLHEVSHSLMARRLDLRVRRITLFIFGGVTDLEKEPDKARHELLIALAGPAMSAVLAVLFSLLWLASWGISEAVALIAAQLAILNMLLAVFNLLPGFPLDGGRVLHSLMWSWKGNPVRASLLATTIGTIVAFVLIAIGLVTIFSVSLIAGVWSMLVGLFLLIGSERSYLRTVLRDRVESLAKTHFEWVGPEMTPRQLLEMRTENRMRCFPVKKEPENEADTELLGLVTLTDIRSLSPEERELTTIGRLMIRREGLETISPEKAAFEALQIMAQNDIHQLPILEDGRLMGFITRADIMDKLKDAA